MAQRTIKIDAQTLLVLQKLKLLYAEYYHRTVTISEVIEMLVDDDMLLKNLKSKLD